MTTKLAQALREYIDHPTGEKAMETSKRWDKVLEELRAEENAPVPPTEPLDYYLALRPRYPVTVHQQVEGEFVAEVRDLPGCYTQGDTLDELWQMVADAITLWITVAHRHGDKIPPPSPPQ